MEIGNIKEKSKSMKLLWLVDFFFEGNEATIKELEEILGVCQRSIYEYIAKINKLICYCNDNHLIVYEKSTKKEKLIKKYSMYAFS